ncbi:SGNH/GDSL hydrolase family protein [Acidisphaera rubrifaciens]|uniref:Lipase n=1 Tax=Acidisphaera rubrifaciens HS-AP3 TaxID=1231350 RepID=A0A0D6P974_9PROT|nr:SGNH/GDSL hydrolase family protein [Acidisphaera rubrifaciens]GAN77414.1 lipase [Acidisphaera rubrifaciens HS-AP3]
MPVRVRSLLRGVASACLAATLSLAVGGAAFARGEAVACPDVAPVMGLALPHLKAAIAHNVQAVIVAFGSSSTQGWMASDAAHTYPAVLQRLLSRALPATHLAVINRGIGGQDAAEELARLDQDVIALRPQLVIWQVGANGALEGIDPALFKRLVVAGIRRMQGAGIDVVLMDNQRAPRILASREHLLMEHSLAEIASVTGSGMFARSALMDAWQAAGRPYAEFIAADKLHQNDLGYRCVAEALARAIVAGLGSGEMVSTH